MLKTSSVAKTLVWFAHFALVYGPGPESLLYYVSAIHLFLKTRSRSFRCAKIINIAKTGKDIYDKDLLKARAQNDFDQEKPLKSIRKITFTVFSLNKSYNM